MKATARCVSRNAAARVDAAEKLAQDVRGYYDANPGLLLAVSGVDRDAVARNLTQQGVDARKVTNVPGGTKEGTVVVAKQAAGAEVARFHSITSIVPFVQLPSTPYDRAVRNVRVGMFEWNGERTIVKSQMFDVGTGAEPYGEGGVWLSPRAYVCLTNVIAISWSVYYLSDTPAKTFVNFELDIGSATLAGVPTLQNVLDAIAARDATGTPYAAYDWTGNRPSDF